MAAVQNIYGVPPPPPEEHHETMENLNNLCPVNVDADLWSGSNVTSQCSTYQLLLSDHGTIFTDDCDRDCHANADQ